MTIAPISAEVSASAISAPSLGAQVGKGGLFDQLLDQVTNMNTQLIAADQSVQQLASGDVENLHQVMLGLEQTRLAFDLMLQVRNKVLDAYQEVMRMQV